jgi:hypothetical protein
MLYEQVVCIGGKEWAIVLDLADGERYHIRYHALSCNADVVLSAATSALGVIAVAAAVRFFGWRWPLTAYVSPDRHSLSRSDNF